MAHILIMTIGSFLFWEKLGIREGFTPVHPDEVLTSGSNSLIETEDHDLFTRLHKMFRLDLPSKMRMKIVGRTRSGISPTLV